MDKVLLKSKFSYRFIYKVLIFFIFINIFICSFSTKQVKWYLEEYYFDFETYFVCNGWLLLLCITLLLFLSSSRLIIQIVEDKIIIKNFLTRKEIEFSFSEIIGLEWSNRNNSIKLRHGPLISINNQAVTILFHDDSRLFISKYEYANYEQLRNLFYIYCQKQNLIERPLSRKKHQLRRKWVTKSSKA